MTEAPLYRRRHAGLTDELDQVATGAAPTSRPTIVMTFARAVYPTTAQAYYACHTVTLGGAQTEGGAGSLAAGSDTLYVYNAGASIPPAGTYAIAEPVGGRWVMQYD